MIPYHLQTLPLLEEKGPGFLARVNSGQGICTSFPGLQQAATGRCTVSVTAPISPEQKSTRQSCRLPLLGGCRVLLKVTGGLLLCFCCLWDGLLCAHVSTHAHAHKHTVATGLGGPRCAVGSFCPCEVTLKNMGVT